jgi:AmpD protein
MNISDHIIDDARYIASPNYDSRPEKTSINLIIIHAISMPVGEYVTENIVKLFTNELNPDDHPDFKAVSDLKVSSHLLITRSGDVLQFVPFHKRAWHAGISVFEEQENCNDFSIGIELEGCDDDIFEEIQYEALNSILNLLKKEYLIPDKNIVGHQHVAPERKTDPGPNFDWSKINAGHLDR